MPATYTVGAGQQYSTVQAAIAAVVSDFSGTLTQDVAIICTAESFSAATVGDFSGVNSSATYRLTLRGASVSTADWPTFTQPSENFLFLLGTNKNITIKWCYIDPKSAGGGYSGLYQGGNDCILEECHVRMPAGAGNESPWVMGDGGDSAHEKVARNVFVYRKAGSGTKPQGFKLAFNCKVVFCSFEGMESGCVVLGSRTEWTIKDCVFSQCTTDIIIGAGTAASDGSFDYNDHFGFTTLGTLNSTNYTTLATWRTATSQEANSVNVDPQYTSTTNLHAAAAGIEGVGVAISGITRDIDGATRDAPPCMGADEFSVNPPPTVTSISPTVMTNDRAYDFTLTGAAFEAGITSVYASKSGQTDITATSVVRVSATSITGRLDATTKATGTWSMNVVNPLGGLGTGTGILTIQAAGTVIKDVVKDSNSLEVQKPPDAVLDPSHPTGTANAILKPPDAAEILSINI